MGWVWAFLILYLFYSKCEPIIKFFQDMCIHKKNNTNKNSQMLRFIYLLAGMVGLLFTNCSANSSGDNSSDLDSVEEDSVTDPFIVDVINPIHDFVSVIEGDTVYFRVIEDSSNVSLVYWRRTNFDNHVIHIPSIVNNETKQYRVHEIGAEAMGIGFYSDKEGLSIWFADNHLVDTIYVPSSVKKIHDSAFTARFRSKDIHIILTDSLEYIGSAALNCMDIRDENDAIILPKNIVGVECLLDDEVHDIPDFKYSKLYIPEHVEYIGGLDNFERNQPLFKRIEVSQRNKHFRTIDGVLFNYNLTKLYWSTVNENLYIPKDICVDKARISELEDGWYSNLQLPMFKSIRTEAGNPYCVAIDDVLYDIKNKCMILSATNPNRKVNVPYWCNSVYLLDGYWHKPLKYIFSDKAKQEDVESFINALKKYTYDDNTTYIFTYRGKTWTSK